jgi:hypothetical protein
MKKLLLTASIAFSLFASKTYYMKEFGEINDGSIFSQNYDIYIVCIDGVQYYILNGFKRSAFAPRYIVKNGKPVIATCKK